MDHKEYKIYKKYIHSLYYCTNIDEINKLVLKDIIRPIDDKITLSLATFSSYPTTACNVSIFLKRSILKHKEFFEVCPKTVSYQLEPKYCFISNHFKKILELSKIDTTKMLTYIDGLSLNPKTKKILKNLIDSYWEIDLRNDIEYTMNHLTKDSFIYIWTHSLEVSKYIKNIALPKNQLNKLKFQFEITSEKNSIVYIKVLYNLMKSLSV